MNTQWYFYLIQAGEHGPVKFGITQNMATRMVTHQTASPEILRILYQLACADRTHAAIIERNFAGATKVYATLADNEWRLPMVKETSEFADPQSSAAQCSYGHLWPDDSYIRENGSALPICKRCLQQIKKRNLYKERDRYRAAKARLPKRELVDSAEYNRRRYHTDPEASRARNRAIYARRMADPVKRAAYNTRQARNRAKRRALLAAHESQAQIAS